MTEIAKSYGGAVFELCVEENCEKLGLEHFCMIETILNQNTDYICLLKDPTIKKEERVSLLDQAFVGINIHILNFMKILIENEYFAEIFNCINEFKTRYNKHFNIVNAVVYTAISLTQEQNDRLTKKLEQITGKNIMLVNHIDPLVIGGIKLKLDDKMLDNSIQNKLKTLRANLLGTMA